MRNNSVRTEIRNDIQALRALAVLAVVVCHMNPSWLPGGYLGVDIFFVISGFVITRALLNTQNIQLGRFWLGRIFRIFPAYAVMLAVVTLVAAMFFLPENFSQFFSSWSKSFSFVSNQYFADYGDYFSPALTEQPLLHTWSLSVEMQFYLFYPLFIVFVLRYRALWLIWALAIVGFVYAQWAWTQAGTHAPLYYALLIRAPEFLLGCLLSAYANNLNSTRFKRFKLAFSMLAFLILSGSLFFIDEKNFSPVASFIVCVGAAFFIAARAEGRLLALYKNKFVLLIGALSYSIYLWHWPVLSFARYMYGDINWTFQLVFGYAVLIFVMAWISSEFVEKKFKLKGVNTVGVVLKKLILIFFVSLSPIVYAKKVNVLVPPMSIELTRYADDKVICHGKILSSCVKGDYQNIKFLMIGDSHAAQLNIAADVAGDALGVGFEVITGSSCIPLPGFNFKKLPEWAQKACQSQIEVVKQKLANAKNIILAGMWSYQFEDESIFDVLNAFFQNAEAKGQRVWVLKQIPKLTKNPMRLMRVQYWGIDARSELAHDWTVANQKLTSIMEKHPSIYLFDPNQFELLATPPLYDGSLLYHDEHHLNEIGSRLYGQLLISLLNR